MDEYLSGLAEELESSLRTADRPHRIDISAVPVKMATDRAVSLGLLAAFAAWTLLESTGNAFAMYLNGCGIVRLQVWVVLAFCLVALPLKFALGVNFGATGVVLASVIAYLLTNVGLYGTIFRSQLLAPTRECP